VTITTTRRLAATICALAIGIVAAGCGGSSTAEKTVTVAPTTPTTVATTPTAPVTTPTTPTAPTDTTADAPFPNAAEIELLTHVPPATAADCGRTRDAARARDAVTSVRCDTATHRVYYEQFAGADDMRTAYQAYLDVNDIERGEGQTCDEGAPAEGVWDGPENRVTCFTDSAGAWVVWNATDLNLVAVAIDADGKLQRVFDWWKSPDSGPTP